MPDSSDDGFTPEAVTARREFAARFTGADLRALEVGPDARAYEGNVEHRVERIRRGSQPPGPQPPADPVTRHCLPALRAGRRDG